MASLNGQGSSAGCPSHPPTAILVLTKSIIRPYAHGDAPSLAKSANNPNVAQYLRNMFPSPYTLADAEWWIEHCLSHPKNEPHENYALIHATSGDVMGGLSIKLGGDVYCRSAELGYWIGEEYWGKGVMVQAVSAFVDWVFENVRVKDKESNEHGLLKVWAGTFGKNTGSEAVLKKIGMQFEGKLRGSVWKNGVVMDQLLYGMTWEDWRNIKAREEAAEL
ncbi:acetyltransferase [Tothia fuscella]|uniref:Acetyltransferase n=1 Tax=Tothia fuscella TaxID=1048955 RepID=A0A9P4NPF0_9PEZI|nr:acetyltransferase [Tothia fuscella]